MHGLSSRGYEPEELELEKVKELKFVTVGCVSRVPFTRMSG